MKVLAYFEAREGRITRNSLELITAGGILGEVTGLVIGKGTKKAALQAAELGVSVIYVPQDVCCQDEIVAVLESEMKAGGYGGLLVPASLEGKDLAPRVAARLSSCSVTDVVEIQKGILLRPAYGGTIYEKMSFMPGRKMVAAIRKGSFPCPLKSGNAQGQIIRKAVDIGPQDIRAFLVEKTRDVTEKADLEGAEIVVAGGRGCQNQETFALVKELAMLLGGEVGATRPAVELGWISRAHQVGQSGKTIAPRLYIACGISGAMQHLSGVADAGYVVAVNKDESAPIFDMADIGIVGRCEKILPLMIQAFR